MSRKRMVVGIVFVITAATSGWLYAESGYENTTRFYDSEAQQKLVLLLRTRGIPHRTDIKGAILYRPEDTGRVEAAEKEILKIYFGNAASVYISRPKEREMFIEELKQQNIKHHTRRVGTSTGEEDWIYWSEKDDAKVKHIQEIVRKKFNEMRR